MNMGFASYLENIQEKLQSYTSSLKEYSKHLDSLPQKQNCCKDCELHNLDFLVRSVQNLLRITDEYLELLTDPNMKLAAEFHNLENQCKMLAQRNSNLEKRVKTLEQENRALRYWIQENMAKLKKASNIRGKVISKLKRWIKENEVVLQNPKTRALLTFNSPPAVRLRELTSQLKEFARKLNNNVPTINIPTIVENQEDLVD